MAARRKNNAKKMPSFKLDKRTEQLVRYWRESVIDGERVEISVSEVRDLGLDANFSEITHGKVDPEFVSNLRNKIIQSFKKRKRNEKKRAPEMARFASDVSEYLEVLICPLRFVRKSRTENSQNYLDLLWIPAVLAPNGSLSVPRRPLPWIPRNFLEPLLEDESIVIGSVEQLERFSLKHPAQDQTSWKGYWNYCNRLFQSVTGKKISQFKLDDYERRANPIIMYDTSSQGSSSGLVRLYDEILLGKRTPGLLPTLSNPPSRERILFSESAGQFRRSAFLHRGQFSNRFALAPSQRRAVHRFFETPDNEILCVTGPPGTGKTTFLQSIIASLWIQAAHNGDRPPVIVACGATNQSVLNIIRSFDSPETKSALEERWLPKITSHGTFCSSFSKAEEVENFLLELRDGKGLSASMEQLAYIRSAEKYFLEHFAAYTGKKLSLEKAVKFLRKQVRNELSSLYRELQRRIDGSTVEWLTNFITPGAGKSFQELVESVETLDNNNRYQLFLLATHYWEARWLLDISQVLASRSARGQNEIRFSGRREDWERRAMITPVFVSTLAMAPRFFDFRQENGEPLVDLIIFDEAGQIPPEAGAACCSLAKKALIVGDTLQLEPFWNVPSHVDVSNLKKFKLIPGHDEEKLFKLKRRGILSSASNLMDLGISASKRQEQSTIGVFLSEHRRSVPEIVSFSNTLAYHGRLEARRKAIPDDHRILPAFGYAHIPGHCERAAGSWKNLFEVEVITTWLKSEQSEIEAFYGGRPIQELVAVITPFAAQNRALELALRKRYPEMIIGTVNALQGAECEIVVFSPVYDQRSTGNFFFDRGVNMLNVAVSRAKDSFLLFGDMGIFNPRANLPSSLLFRYLVSDYEKNELEGVELPKKKHFQENESMRLSTLAEHRGILSAALREAEKSVLIVSPTVSLYAIEADNLESLIKNALDRGIKVDIYTDSTIDLDSNTGRLRKAARMGREALLKTGANLVVADRIHNKAIAVDSDTLIEGSFNWLSAVRIRGSKTQKLEVSWYYRGPKVVEEVEQLREVLAYQSSEQLPIFPGEEEEPSIQQPLRVNE